jgi:CheY-like chemotaxis protein
LLDLMMPELDGYAVLEMLSRHIPKDEYLPVLVLTADATIAARRKALALGAKDFLTKPFDTIEAMLRVWNLLETRMLYRHLKQLNTEVKPIQHTPHTAE